MAELLGKLNELYLIPNDTHLFCPRTSTNELEDFFDEDIGEALNRENEVDREKRRKLVEAAQERGRLTMECTLIWAFDGPDAEQHAIQLKERLSGLLTSCEVCIREFHRERRQMKTKLETQFDESEVAKFLELFDEITANRIVKGLDSLTHILRELPPEMRSITSVESYQVLPIFEALSCESFVKNESLLTRSFDEPFKLIQTRRRLRLRGIVPAMTHFLFSPNETRAEWAMFSWTKMKKTPTKIDWNWCIRDPLYGAMLRVQMNCLEVEFLPTFWGGTRMIVDRLDQNLITHYLRDIGIDIYRLALEHLSVDSECFPDVLGTMQLLLKKSPTTFWDAMAAISPATVIEQIFKNKPMLRALGQGVDETVLGECFGWISPLLDSIKVPNLGPPCVAMASQLLGRLQSEEFAPTSRSYCLRLGMFVLSSTLRKMIETSSGPSSGPGSNGPAFVGAATVSHVLEIVDRHASTILDTIDSSEASEKTVNVALGIIEQAIQLDCLAVVVTSRQLKKGEAIDPSIGKSRSSLVWGHVSNAVKAPDTKMPTTALSGAWELIGLEPIVTKNPAHITDDMKQFNAKFESISQNISDILYKLSDFQPDDMDAIFEDRRLARAVLSHLFFSTKEPHQGVVELLKIISVRDTRRDAINHFLQAFFVNTLSSISESLSRIALRKAFAPTPALLKVCADVVENLCNAQDGLLRSKTLSEDEIEATELFWKALWFALRIIFENTEDWSNLGHDKNMMMDFCRDTMQLADNLFDHSSIFVSAIAGVNVTEKNEVLKRLVSRPATTFPPMAKWLRLRDDFLITRSVGLTSKLLKTLKSVDVNVVEGAVVYVGEVITGTVKSKLSAYQKVELQSALETYVGRPFRTPKEQPKTSQKQKSLSSFFKPRIEEDIPSVVSSDNEVLDDEASMDKLLQGAAAYKARLDVQKKKQATMPVRPASNSKSATDVSEFKKKRQAEMEAQKKNKALAIAQAKKSVAKDPAEKGTGIYVSSEEDTDDGDELDRELFGLSKSTKKERKPAGGKPLEMFSMPKGPVKKQRQVRSAKDMRARLAPDLSNLHKTILAWDYFHQGDAPPKAQFDITKHVPDKFVTPNEYQNAFQPLLILEAWQGFVKAREENTFKPYEIKIVSRSSVDAFQEFSSTLAQSENKEIGISEGDVVLLSKDHSPATASESPHCLARVFRIKRQKAVLEVSYRIVPGNPLQTSLNPGGSVWGAKIQSLTPLEREYGALAGLQYYDLCDEIIKGSPSPLLNYSDKQLQPLISNYSVNKAQAKAVQSAIDNDAFTLIQGPPGSGKTKTIVAIVGALLTDSIRAQAKPIATPITTNGFQPNRATAPPSKKLLVCAPSNAAVDELVMRFKQGVKSLSGQHKKINVVRLGRSDAINTNILDVTLDELVKAKLGLEAKHSGREDHSQIFKDHQAVSEKLREAREALDRGEAKGDDAKKLKEDFDALRRRKALLGTQIENVRDAEANMGRQAELNRRRAQQQVLDESQIICATLSGSGHEMFQTLNIEFETVIVDEAAQCVEMSSIIPLKYGCAKCIMVGDPKQLPPTVFSKLAAGLKYERSLFVRMQGNHPDAVHLLDTQYRMHPEISAFPSQTFYDGLLLDGPEMASLRERPWHANPVLGPYRFFDVQGQHSAAPKGHSLVNYAEINFALELYQTLCSTLRGGFSLDGKVGIITPYKSQLRELKMRFMQKYGESIFERVEFNTTDAFQGRESEVIIFSCVRASPAGGIGFLQDIRRMNVGLTRAKSSLFVLGNSQSLVRGEYWKKLVDDAKKRDRYTEGNLAAALRSGVSKASVSASHDPPRKSSTTGRIKPDEQKAEGNGAIKSADASRRSSHSNIKPTQFKSDTDIASKSKLSIVKSEHDAKADNTKMHGIKKESEAGSPMEVDDVMSKLDSHLAAQNDAVRVKQEALESRPKPEPGKAPLPRPKKRKETDPFIKRQPVKKPKPS